MNPTLRRLLVSTVAVTLSLAPAALAQEPLQAAFTAAPEPPRLGESVQLTATSTGGSPFAPITHTWDLDGDGEFDDAEGNVTKTRFDSGGAHVVRLRASQPVDGVLRTSVAERTFVLEGPTATPTPTPTATATPVQTPVAPPNQPPVARLDRECTRHGQLTLCALGIAFQGAPKTISAAPSSDPDGQLVLYEWDLDGDGTFERATGTTPTVTHTFEPKPRRTIAPAVREWTVSVRVTDDAGAQATTSFTVTVKPPKCVKEVKVGAFTATGTCLRDYGGQHRSTEPVSLNGIAIEPRDGQWVTISKDKIASKRARVSMNAGGTYATLINGEFEWEPDGKQLKGFKLDPNAKVNGLKVTGVQGTPGLVGTQARVKVFVALPAQFGGATSGDPVTLGGTATASSGAFSFTVPSAALGPIGLQELKVSYDGVNLWEVAARVKLPAPAAVDIKGGVGIRSNGKFAYGEAEAKWDNGGLALGGPLPVFLERIKFRIEIDPPESDCVPMVGVKPIPWPDFLGPRPANLAKTVDFGRPTFAMCGTVALTAGPAVGGKAAARVTAGLGWATYADRPWVLRARGDLELVEVKVAEVAFAVHGDGYITAYGKFRWGVDGVASISGGLSLEMLKTKFNATARVDACIELVDWCAGARAIISSRGIAACLEIDLGFGDWTPGVGYYWGKGFPRGYFDGCDIGDYRVAISRPKAAAAQFTGEARTVDLGAGLPGTSLLIQGAGAPPKVTIAGPGRTITAGAGPKTLGEGFVLIEDPRTNSTQVLIAKPAAGRWTITPQFGSAAITEVLAADGLAEPEVSAKVVRPGVLRYAVKPVAGQKVTFVERAGEAGGEIGVARGEKGVLRWTPAAGAAGKRRLVALVEQDGELRREVDLGAYQAPKAQKPRAVRGLKVRAGGARWKPLRGAAAYTVQIKLRGGRTLVKQVRTPKVAFRGRAARVTVQAVSPTGITGPRTAARRP